MGRRNGNVKRSRKRKLPKSGGHRPQFTASDQRVRPPTPINEVVAPIGKCGKKLRYATREDAEKALRNAQRNRRNTEHVEKRVYGGGDCDRCDGWHLTSKEQWSPRGSV